MMGNFPRFMTICLCIVLSHSRIVYCLEHFYDTFYAIVTVKAGKKHETTYLQS